MENFCVITNSYKDKEIKTASLIRDYIVKKGGNCIVLDNVDCTNGEYIEISTEDVPKDTQCVITVGGDGTLLHTTKNLLDMDVVFVGVNKGMLGFLAEISPDNIYEALDKLLNNQFNVESRMMLRGEIYRKNKMIQSSVVLNDIVIHRGGDLIVNDYNVFVNGSMLGTFQADGIIVSTPTGSTAYNLSAGGPVARPDSHMIMITPICPHTLANRSIIMSRNDKIEVHISESRSRGDDKRQVAFDGDCIFNIVSGDVIKICEAERCTKIAKLDESSFLQAIKDKLK